MKRTALRALLAMGLLLLTTIAAACGNTSTENSSGSGLHWERFSVASTTPNPYSLPSLGDSIWYNNCTRNVEWYKWLSGLSSAHLPLKYVNDTFWSWNGLKWLPIKVASTFYPGAFFPLTTWDSSKCTAIVIESPPFYLPAAFHPGQILNPTWEWDGKSWRMADVTSPGIYISAVMVYDPATRTVMLCTQDIYPTTGDGTWTVGTVSQGDPYQIVQEIRQLGLQERQSVVNPIARESNASSTWTFNGTIWVQQHPANNPPAPMAAMAAYDPAIRSVVMYEDALSYSKHKEVYETWLWNGVTWTSVHSKTMPRVDDYIGDVMVYDPLLHGIVLYNQASREIWLWKNTSWRRLGTTNTMSSVPRLAGAMVFDVSTGQLILAGGEPEGRPPHYNTWVLTGSTHQ